MQIEKEKRESDMQNSGSRWKAAEVSKSRPLKNYSSKLIEDKNQAIKGKKLGGTINISTDKITTRGSTNNNTN